ncbi:MAG: type I 3-dehydroquinate dehydratase [Pseudomonadota bacterium]
MICIPIFESSTAAAVAAMKRAAERADIIELRLDALDSPDVAALLRERPSIPLIATARRTDEGGGRNPLPEPERLEMLARAAELGADYIDVELATETALRSRLIERKGGAAVIISWHDFEATPGRDALKDTLRRCFDAGADVCKLVTMARRSADCATMLEVVAEAARSGRRVIGFCMGEAGRFSRLATLFMGGLVTYAYLPPGPVVAPGMLSLDELKQYLGALRYEAE